MEKGQILHGRINCVLYSRIGKSTDRAAELGQVDLGHVGMQG